MITRTIKQTETTAYIAKVQLQFPRRSLFSAMFPVIRLISVLTTIWPSEAWQGQQYYPTSYCTFPVNNIKVIDWHVHLVVFVLFCTLTIQLQKPARDLSIDDSLQLHAIVFCRICFYSVLPWISLYLFHLHLDIACIVYVEEVWTQPVSARRCRTTSVVRSNGFSAPPTLTFTLRSD